MKMKLTFNLIIIFLSTLSATTLECRPVKEKIEKLVCWLETTRLPAKRTVHFRWHSVTTPQDDREYSVSLPAHHGSVYDYRLLRGRAQGLWEITVRIDGVDEAHHQFYLKDDVIQ